MLRLNSPVFATTLFLAACNEPATGSAAQSGAGTGGLVAGNSGNSAVAGSTNPVPVGAAGQINGATGGATLGGSSNASAAGSGNVSNVQAGTSSVPLPQGGSTSGPGGGGASNHSPAGSDGTAGSANSSGSDPSTVHFFLPTGEPDNTSAPYLEVDSSGATHAIYPAYAGGDAYYAYCGTNCQSSGDVKVVRFPTEGTVANAMIALTADGHPRVLLSTFQKLYYASCDANCASSSGWTQTMILDHQGDREVSGEALALDPSGRPRFLMHTYRAYLGIGQKAPATYVVSCDASCNDPAHWTTSQIAEEIWEGSHLRYDAKGTAHLATVVRLTEGDQAGEKMSAYFACSGNCASNAGWSGIGFVKPYESETEAVRMLPTVALALTRNGNPRIAILGKAADGSKNILYFECDNQCIDDHWMGIVVSNHSKITAGLDLVVDGGDRPRLAYSIDYNIGLAYCDNLPCAASNSDWGLTKVELGSDMPPDTIFLEPNCTVGAWFLHSPSVALTAGGAPRVGYQSRDISAGWSQPDPTKPRCVAGTDMTWTRLALMKSYR